MINSINKIEFSIGGEVTGDNANFFIEDLQLMNF